MNNGDLSSVKRKRKKKQQPKIVLTFKYYFMTKCACNKIHIVRTPCPKLFTLVPLMFDNISVSISLKSSYYYFTRPTRPPLSPSPPQTFGNCFCRALCNFSFMKIIFHRRMNFHFHFQSAHSMAISLPNNRHDDDDVSFA